MWLDGRYRPVCSWHLNLFLEFASPDPSYDSYRLRNRQLRLEIRPERPSKHRKRATKLRRKLIIRRLRRRRPIRLPSIKLGTVSSDRAPRIRRTSSLRPLPSDITLLVSMMKELRRFNWLRAFYNLFFIVAFEHFIFLSIANKRS